MEKPRVIMCKGLPASGKSTWAKEFVAKNPNFIRLNKDDFRAMMGGYSKDKEMVVLKMRDAAIAACANDKLGVVVDDTNLDEKHEKAISLIAAVHGMKFETKFFDVPLSECLERNAVRENAVPERVIKDMAFKYNVGLPKEIPNPCNEELPRAFIFDIDGTLANMNGRSPYDYTKVSTDLPQWDVINMSVDLNEAGYVIIVVSGREGTVQCATDTLSWLNAMRVPFAQLFMREEGDKRPDNEVKKEIFMRNILPHYNVVGVFDDRPRVIRMWRGLGLRCYDVIGADEF